MPSDSHPFRHNLAAALLTDDWVPVVLLRRARQAAPKRCRWVKPLVERVFAAYPERPHSRTLLAFLAADAPLGQHLAGAEPTPQRRFPWPQRMEPSAVGWLGPRLELPTLAALADWLGLTSGQLDWYADLRGLNTRARADPFRLYRTAWVPKPGANPARKFRLLEVPCPGLMRVQRQITRELLNLLPPHGAAHGFRPGRSIRTNAEPHCGRRVLLRFDLRDFFPSVSAARVRAVFAAVGYPEPVAAALTGLCTTRLPLDVWEARPHPAPDGSDHGTGVRLRQRHLPQGAPTSPALANLCAFGLDVRLAALAAELDATYTRYADDLTFSGPDDLGRAAGRVRHLATRIAAEEGFAVNPHKTRVQRQGDRQTVAGVVVNVRPNVRRSEFDALKAILTNCRRHGPASQNRAGVADFRAHLAGRVSHVAALNPIRGRKLWALFERIAWGGVGDPRISDVDVR